MLDGLAMQNVSDQDEREDDVSWVIRIDSSYAQATPVSERCGDVGVPRFRGGDPANELRIA
jgi:hypothetical protein